MEEQTFSTWCYLLAFVAGSATGWHVREILFRKIERDSIREEIAKHYPGKDEEKCSF